MLSSDSLRPRDSRQIDRVEARSSCDGSCLVSSERASSASAIRAAARTIATVCGPTRSAPPVTSRTPSSDDEAGSWIGVAAQLQRFTELRKCSAPITVAVRSSAMAMPGALVPASRSSQFDPSTKPIVSAARRTAGLPHTHSSCPAASETAMIASQSRAACPSTSSSSGNTWASGCASR